MKTVINEAKAVHGTKEWSSSSVNLQEGCEHGCLYCYAQTLSNRFKRSTPDAWTFPSVRTDKVEKTYRKRTGRIMFPSSHDITVSNLRECLIVLKKMLASGNEVLIVSKPHLSCVGILCKDLRPWRDQITFRFTIGSASNDALEYWEPNAPSFEERLAALRVAHSQGYATSVSCEPMLDLNIAAVINAVRPFVTDSIWLGRVNGLRQSISINRPTDKAAKLAAEKLLSEQTDGYLRDLYRRYKDDPLIKFKDSIKKAAGVERPTEKGLDI